VEEETYTPEQLAIWKEEDAYWEWLTFFLDRWSFTLLVCLVIAGQILYAILRAVI